VLGIGATNENMWKIVLTISSLWSAIVAAFSLQAVSKQIRQLQPKVKLLNASEKNTQGDKSDKAEIN